MKKFTKLLISSVLALSIVFSYGGTAYAKTLNSDQSNLVSIEEYEDAMSQIYANYGIGWKIIDSSDSKPITKAVYNSEIKRAYKECEEYQAQLNKSKSENLDSIQVSNTDMGINSLMPVRKNVYGYATYESWPFYKCQLMATADITYNADTGSIMYINSSNIRYNIAVNLDQWDDQGSYVEIIWGSQCRAHFIGTLYFSYTVIITGQKISLSVPVDTYGYMG